MPTYAAQAKVINQNIEAMILNLKERFDINLTVRIIPDKIILNPKPPKHPYAKNDSILLLAISGSIDPTNPYIINPVINTHIVQMKYSNLLFLLMKFHPSYQ